MITLVISGIGGPILLLLRGCLVGSGCSESGIGTGSSLQEIFPAALLPKAIPSIYESTFLRDLHFPARLELTGRESHLQLMS